MNQLTGTRILVTGGAGFVGSFVVEQLLDQNVREIVIIDNLVRGSLRNIEKAMESGRVKLIQDDIRHRDVVDRLCDGTDYCFHLAAMRITHCAAEPRLALETMYDGTFNVLESCVKHKIKKLVMASSASIYGQAEIFPTKEDHHPYNNRTLYGAAKMANELMARSFEAMYGLKFNALRYFNIYGPRMDIHGKYTEVLIRWYYLLKEGKSPLIFGDGKQTMDFIYVEEIARATILAMISDVSGEVFNIASGVETSLSDLCDALVAVMGKNVKPEHMAIPDERKKVEVMRRLADVSKARDLIGFDSKVDLNDGLRRLIQWLDVQTEKIGVGA